VACAKNGEVRRFESRYGRDTLLRRHQIGLHYAFPISCEIVCYQRPPAWALDRERQLRDALSVSSQEPSLDALPFTVLSKESAENVGAAVLAA